MTEPNYNRYSAHINLEEIGVKGQKKIQEAKVLVVGAGGLGCPALQYLSASGIGTIGVIDYDTVNMNNLPRQILYNSMHLGHNKAISACRILSQNASKMVPYPYALTRENALELCKQYDVILDCTDNSSTRYLISDAALICGIPVVYAGVHKFEGQVSVFNYKNGPSYRCLFPKESVKKGCVKCNETGVLSTVPGIAGIYQANECFKIILEMGGVLSGKLLVFNLKGINNLIVNFERKTNALDLAQKTFDIIQVK